MHNLQGNWLQSKALICPFWLLRTIAKKHPWFELCQCQCRMAQHRTHVEGWIRSMCAERLSAHSPSLASLLPHQETEWAIVIELWVSGWICSGVEMGKGGSYPKWGSFQVPLSGLSTTKLGIWLDNSLCSIRTPGRDVVNDYLIWSWLIPQASIFKCLHQRASR